MNKVGLGLLRTFKRLIDFADQAALDFTGFLVTHAQDPPSLGDPFELCFHPKLRDTIWKGFK